MNLWQDRDKPIIGLAPMDGITDAAFRAITASYGKPDVVITEFTHVQGLWQGKLELYKDLLYSDKQRPVVAQIFGSEPDYFYKAAHILCELGFDGIDINMGCPANSVIKRGGGAALIQTPKLAQEIITRTKEGVRDWVNGQTLEDISLDKDKIHYIRKFKETVSMPSTRYCIPISVKTRIGYDKNSITTWIPQLLEAKPHAISIHGRTFKQQYSGEADWEAIGLARTIVHGSDTSILGNGDIESLAQAYEKIQLFGIDGVLIGRASLGNPWIFSNTVPTLRERLSIMVEHTKIHESIKGGYAHHQMFKHFGWYCKNFPKAKELRIDLISSTRSPEDVQHIVNTFLNSLKLYGEDTRPVELI